MEMSDKKKDKKTDYRFVVHQYTLDEVVGDKTYPQEVVGIGLYDPYKDCIYPLPITKFLEQFRNKNGSLSSQKNPAEAIKRFLNYCREYAMENDPDFLDIKEKGIKGLKLEHGSHYITWLSQKCRHENLSPDYVKGDIRYLNKFYFYLQSEGIIEKQFEREYKELVRRKPGGKGNEKIKVQVEIDIFSKDGLGTVYPPDRLKKKVQKLKDFGKDRYLLVKEFIDTADLVEPDIVVGLYLQFFGGLRRGEVVNLTRNALLETDDSYIVDVDDRRKILFPDKTDTKSEQVKNPRYQGVLWHKRMEYAISKHFERLNLLEKQGKLKIPQALLVNNRTMKPITGANYWEKFNRVREKYLDRLAESGRTEHYLFLKDKEWSTHLGRGCFTNFCLDTGMTIGEVAVARGDASPYSMLDYLEEKVAVQTLRDAMNHIETAFKHAEKNQDGLLKVQSKIDENRKERWGETYEPKYL
jgi:integrase